VSLPKTGGIFISCAFALALSVRGRGFLRDRSAPARFLAWGTVALTVFCLLITLPGTNAYDKLGYLVFIPFAIVGGFALGDAVARPLGRGRAAAWAAAFLLPVNAIALVSCFGTDDQAVATPAEARLSVWIREHTPPDAVLLDDHDRVVFIVTAPRRYFFGQWAYAQQWGYPKAEMSRRFHAVRSLYAAAPLDGTALEVLGGVEAPLYAIVRPEHREQGAAVTRRPDLFTVVHEDSSLAVVRIDAAACRAAAARQTDRVSTEELIRASGL
jgi:hypothetical protein